MAKCKYTIEQLKEAVSSSLMFREVMEKLNLLPKGISYQSMKRLIKEHNIDTSHFKRDYKRHKKEPLTVGSLEKYLNNSVKITSHKLKLKLIIVGLKDRKCEMCNNAEWLGQPIPIELDHIDGNHCNNNLINLRILCPTCHALTSKYRGQPKKPKNLCIDCNKEIKKESVRCRNCAAKETKLKNNSSKLEETVYCSCGNPIKKRSKKCKPCFNENREKKIVWPPIEELVSMIEQSSFLTVGKQLGVSDNAVRKYLKKRASLPKSKFSHIKITEGGT